MLIMSVNTVILNMKILLVFHLILFSDWDADDLLYSDNENHKGSQQKQSSSSSSGEISE